MTERMESSNFGPAELPESEADLFEDLPSAEKMRDASLAILEEERAGLMEKIGRQQERAWLACGLAVAALATVGGENIPQVREALTAWDKSSSLDVNLNIFRALGVNPTFAMLGAVAESAGRIIHTGVLESKLRRLDRMKMKKLNPNDAK